MDIPQLTSSQRGGVILGLNALVFGALSTGVVVVVLALLALAYSPHSTLIKDQKAYCKTVTDPSPGSLCAP